MTGRSGGSTPGIAGAGTAPRCGSRRLSCAVAIPLSLAAVVLCDACDRSECDAATFVARCEGGVHVYCTSDWDDYLHREDCAASGRVCLRTETGADCILPERLACDPSGGPSCSTDGRALLTCSGLVGFAKKRDECGADEVCAKASTTAFCAYASGTGCPGDGAFCSADLTRVLVCDGTGTYPLVQARCQAPATCIEGGSAGARCGTPGR